MEHENPGQSGVEEDIQKAIDEILKEDYKPNPEGKYEELEKQEVPPGPSPDSDSAPTTKDYPLPVFLKAAMVTVGLVAVFLLAIIFFAKVALPPAILPIQNENGVAELHDVSFKVSGVERKDNQISAVLSVSNNGERNLFLTVRGVFLQDQNGVQYLPNLFVGEIPSGFFGGKIPSGNAVAATICFDGVPTDVPLTLVIQNISDTHHYVWDYMVSLP